MEELYIYALLCAIGYDKTKEYRETLDCLFLDNPTDENLFDLEERKTKDAILHTIHMLYASGTEPVAFSKKLMSFLQAIYEKSDIYEFADRMCKLYYLLPDCISVQEAFYMFLYAEEDLNYGNEEWSRNSYETALHFYDE